MVGVFLAALSLLSGNAVGNGVKAEWPRVDTKATVSWITNGVFASHSNFVATALDGRGRSRLLNGNVFGDGNAMVYGPWAAGRKNASFVVDLKSPYLVRKVTLWSAEQRGVRGCAGFSVALSRDGRSFTELAKCENPADYDVPRKGKGIICAPLDCTLEKPAVARYVRIVAEQHPGRRQMVLGEVAVWGEPPPMGTDIEELAPENSRPTVPLAVDGWGSGAATFEWKGFKVAGDVVKWRFYASDRPFSDIRDEGVVRLAELGKDARSYMVCPLRPSVTRHYAVSAVYEGGESPKVKSVAHAPVGPLEVRRFRDMLGFNFYWGGGGANERTSKAYYDVAADFLVDIGIRRIRWWQTPEWAVRDQYLKRGIELNGWAGQKDVARKYGLYLRDIGNEPELGPRTPSECVETHRKVREDWKDMGSDYKFYGPVVGISSRGFEYLKGFVEAGGAEYVDAIDLHTYCGSTSEYVYPKGYPAGAPEAIIGRVREIRAWLKERGVDKPFTCSEWGYSDTKTANPHMKDPTPLRKAQFLVRGCIIHHVLGFRRLYMYSFYDEGTDPAYSEHLFGVVTRDCQKKPAYYALKNMVATVGDARAESKMSGLGDGDYGFVFRNVDKPGFVTVVWNGASERRGIFRTKATDVRVVSLFGEARSVKPKDDGTFLAKFGASPVYLVADEPIEAVKIEDERECPVIAERRLAVTAREPTVVFAAGDAVVVRYAIGNPTGEPIAAQIALKNLSGETLAELKETISPGETREISLPAQMKGRALDQFRLVVDYDAEGESRCETCGTWVRVLGTGDAVARVERVRFANLTDNVYVLGNDRLEISVLPSAGGQVLEIFDKMTRRNQVSLDYGDVPKLKSIPFAHGLWDSLSLRGDSGRGCGYSRRTPFAVRSAEGALCLVAETDGARMEKTLRLEDNRLSLTVEVTNATDGFLTARWHLHPEYLPGGSADSYSDYMVTPLKTGEYKLVFWSGLGERRMEPVTDGWWRMVDPMSGYQIRQTFDHSRYENLKVWFGVGTWNVELFSRPERMGAGESVVYSVGWMFGAGQ